MITSESIIKNDWLDEILKASQLTIDHRFKKWAKYVDDCNMSIDDGKMYEGEWIRPGTVQVPVGRHRLILVCATSGTNKYHYRYFRVLLMQPDTELSLTDIETSDRSDGWALRIRRQMCTLLEELKLRHEGLVPTDTALVAGESFLSAISRLPEDEQLRWHIWLLRGKSPQFVVQFRNEIDVILNITTKE